MRVARYHEFGAPDVIEVEEIEPLEPRSDEVRVSVEAAGVNPCDALRRQGLWDDELPLISGSDFAGVVEAVGDSGGEYAVGDEVFGTVPRLNVSGSRGDRQGVYAERATVRTDRLTSLPESVPFAEAAAAGIVSGTAWRALQELGELPPRGTALIHGGSGGVGHVAVQLAAAMGANVFATASPANREIVREFGADRVFDYRREDLESAIEQAAPDGIDLLLDHMFETHCQLDINVAAKDGDVLVIGNNYDQPQITDLTTAIGKDVTIQPFDTLNLDPIDDTLAQISRLMAAGDITIEIARKYTLAEAAEAHRAVSEDSFVGKLVIVP
ncbi:quinone oxidoreductase family protein [Halorientalis pallida]|uniref:NADPH:quinone reductase n=1 Tax=Halorientalis pallida TaxID=2479928 RepID=A0A498L2A1_9EURY|nr:NADPH:quinone reductase [Halorientalis pallida]RXK47901.1 NADPH:quinone reductase [Halorientalis pallida]